MNLQYYGFGKYQSTLTFNLQYDFNTQIEETYLNNLDNLAQWKEYQNDTK